jgi:hypothetical protein
MSGGSLQVFSGFLWCSATSRVAIGLLRSDKNVANSESMMMNYHYQILHQSPSPEIHPDCSPSAHVGHNWAILSAEGAEMRSKADTYSEEAKKRYATFAERLGGNTRLKIRSGS